MALPSATMTLVADPPRMVPGPGRPRGGPTRATREAKAFAERILDDPEYEKSLIRRIKTDSLPPAIEVLLMYYRYGKPKETVEVNVAPEDYERMTDEQLASRARLVLEVAKARQLAESQNAISVNERVNETSSDSHSTT